MTWFKVDDNFPEHPKLDELEMDPDRWARAVAVWLTVGCHCSRNSTDGQISPERLVRATPLKEGALDVAKDLVSIGLWERDGDRFRYHDWADYQPTRAELEGERKAAAARQRRRRTRLRLRNAHELGEHPEPVDDCPLCSREVSRRDSRVTDPVTVTRDNHRDSRVTDPVTVTRDNHRDSRRDRPRDTGPPVTRDVTRDNDRDTTRDVRRDKDAPVTRESQDPVPSRPVPSRQLNEGERTALGQIDDEVELEAFQVEELGTPRFKQLGGKDAAALNNLCPIRGWEYRAAMARPVKYWGGFIKVMLEIREEQSKPKPPAARKKPPTRVQLDDDLTERQRLSATVERLANGG